MTGLPGSRIKHVDGGCTPCTCFFSAADRFVRRSRPWNETVVSPRRVAAQEAQSEDCARPPTGRRMGASVVRLLDDRLNHLTLVFPSQRDTACKHRVARPAPPSGMFVWPFNRPDSATPFRQGRKYDSDRAPCKQPRLFLSLDNSCPVTLLHLAIAIAQRCPRPPRRLKFLKSASFGTRLSSVSSSTTCFSLRLGYSDYFSLFASPLSIPSTSPSSGNRSAP